MQLYAIKFLPILKYKIWGGDLIANLYNTNANQPIGESWELCDREDENSVVANGWLQGKTFKEIKYLLKNQLLGSKINYQKPFPLLVKLLDANQDLSLQVHPTKQTAKLFSNASSKSEFWYVLQANKNAGIIAGVNNINNKQQFGNAIKNGSILNKYNVFNTKPHSFYYIPSGTVHAILKGNFILEIQENSDTTFRVFDYNRLENGKPRDLHIQQSIQCFKNFKNIKHYNAPHTTSNNVLLNNALFKVNSYAINNVNSTKTLATKNNCKVISVTKGSLSISVNNITTQLNTYNSALLPANLNFVITSLQPNTTFLTTHYNG